ncbi:response regulator [Cerasicoccus maritimus]|uniref:response regulator n=1 Tax=Cerasicoccus maritimus TaxID=490089 RepID=UPI0028526D66|nr:response regulator [Cerasicoccus maritimus]
MRILYWDDSDAVLENVTKKLNKLCHKTVTARSIEECKLALENKEEPIDLFIADHKADESDGMNFIMGAKATDPELHVVVLTPAILRSEYNQLQMCGIEVLKKPILLDQVVRPFLSPDKRRKKVQQPMITPAPTNKKVGLLGIESDDTEPASEPVAPALTSASDRPDGMPPPPGATDAEPPKKRKGLTRLFARS